VFVRSFGKFKLKIGLKPNANRTQSERWWLMPNGDVRNVVLEKLSGQCYQRWPLKAND
jgi:hypothetical protein